MEGVLGSHSDALQITLEGVDVQLDCPRCPDHPEDLGHLLLQCTFARQAWALTEIPWHCVDHDPEDIEKWMQGVFGRLGCGEFTLFLTVCWSLWFSRNQLIFEAQPGSPPEVVEHARRLLRASANDPQCVVPMRDSWACF
ncbi:hypothetical protein Salat_2119800 [Sesamum alatum]|uniref:Reverse transcriptase zinc-binding domain-containing protein n=1 Tax=Sesamum alatum TaxID=300844 RepID=A0AAE1Y1T3_9LAMI|nr:hypothetical protein Salat_2119800 [Sesamum alatum]